MLAQNSTSSSGSRIEYIDLAKGFCILLVVWTHSLGPLNSPDYFLKDALSMFRMPLYFFLSGLFFKTYEGFLGFLKRKVNKLLIPFIFWHVLFVLSVPFFSRTEVFSWNLLWNFILPGKDPHNTALWFLCCLFSLNIIFYMLIMLCNTIQSKWKKNTFLAMIVMLMGIFGYFCSMNHILLPIKLETICTAMPFFAIGYAIGQHRNILTITGFDKWLIPVSIVCLFITYLITSGEVGYRTNTYGKNNIIQIYSGGLLGIISIILLSKKLRYLPFVSYIGRYSIMVLVTHLPVVWWLAFYINKLGLHWLLTALASTIVVSLSYLLLIPLFKHFLPYVTAQKDVLKIKDFSNTKN